MLSFLSISRCSILFLLAIIPESYGLPWDNFTTPLAELYYSRPDLRPPAMNITLFNSTATTSGYVFITPYQELQAGPYIFDKSGNLVWSGYASTGPWNAHNLHVCQYKGEDHLCLFQGNQHPGYARGHGVILDSNYKIVKTVESGGDVSAADQHEFKLVNNGRSALITIYQNTPYDLTRLGVNTQGWMQDSIFQEIDVETGKVLFEWNALNHINPWFSYVYPNTSDIVGTGLDSQSPWDFFHINSIDKSAVTGNYIISARHMSTIYNINGTDGSIIWKLESGGNSDFKCMDFNFAFQHNAVILDEGEDWITISIYDNASNNFNHTAKFSTGKIITVDLTAKTAYLTGPMTRWPWTDARSASQGSSQVLPNGNIFNCYGDLPYFSEHNKNGHPIWAGQIGNTNGAVMSYRAFSFPWKSIPKDTRPALWTYSRDNDALVAAYVSWNGATEVKEWSFYGSLSRDEPFTKLGTANKVGFETMYTSDTHYNFMFAEAVGYDGRSLRNSSLIQTWVPSAKLAVNCLDTHCPQAPL